MIIGVPKEIKNNEYRVALLPVGVEMALPANDWEVRLNGECDIFIHGWQTSYYGQVPTGSPGVVYPNLTNHQTRGFGLRGGVSLIKKTGGLNFLISPYIRYWNIKESQTNIASNEFGTLTGYEPANTSTEIGARLGVQF